MELLKGLGDFISKKPEQFSIITDMLGQGFDPDNPFAGIGSALAKSSLATKALAEEKAERNEWRGLLAKLISGEVPMSEAGKVGVTSANLKPNKEGKMPELSLSITPEGTKQPQQAQPPQQLNIGDLVKSPF